MNINTLVVGPLATNCYILNIDDDYIVIDPGSDSDLIKECIKGKLHAILLTHHHFDHTGAITDLVNTYDVPVIDKDYFFNNSISGIGPFKFKTIYNPGHTLDSISFYFSDINSMFVGDFIFKGCIGRCDLGGDESLMKESLKKLLDIDKTVKIYPGHGEESTIGNELDMINYYINIL